MHLFLRIRSKSFKNCSIWKLHATKCLQTIRNMFQKMELHLKQCRSTMIFQPMTVWLSVLFTPCQQRYTLKSFSILKVFRYYTSKRSKYIILIFAISTSSICTVRVFTYPQMKPIHHIITLVTVWSNIPWRPSQVNSPLTCHDTLPFEKARRHPATGNVFIWEASNKWPRRRNLVLKLRELQPVITLPPSQVLWCQHRLQISLLNRFDIPRCSLCIGPNILAEHTASGNNLRASFKLSNNDGNRENKSSDANYPDSNISSHLQRLSDAAFISKNLYMMIECSSQSLKVLALFQIFSPYILQNCHE